MSTTMEGIIPFVCGAIKKRRTATKSAADYERLPSAGAATTTLAEADRFVAVGSGGGGAYRSQSCRFDVVARSRGDLWRDGDALPPESNPDEEAFPPGRDGRGVSRSRRFGSMRLLAACVGGP